MAHPYGQLANESELSNIFNDFIGCHTESGFEDFSVFVISAIGLNLTN